MKAVLLGMNNPVSSRPECALYPYPPGCTGHRVWQLLRTRVDVSRLDYIRGFERINLLNSRKWDRERARAVAERLPSLYVGRTVLIFGDAVRRCIGVEKTLIHPVEWRGVTWRQLPHPSGRCRWYNDPECAALAATLLEELYLQGKSHGNE